MSGFVVMHRDAVDHHLFGRDTARLGAWMWLIVKACWKPTRFNISGRSVTLERGQLCASRSQLAEAWGMSPSAVERFLTRLEAECMIERATGQGRSIITICNYAKYQDVSDAPGQATEQREYPNATRSKTGQATGQASDSASNGNHCEIRRLENQTGQATGQASDSDRTTKEQYNKGTSISSGDKSPSDIQPARKSGSVEKADPYPMPEGTDPEVWSDFLKNRKRKNLPNTATAHKRLMDDLARLSTPTWPPPRLLEYAASKGWGGIYPPHDDDITKFEPQQDNRHGNTHRQAPIGMGRTEAAARLALERMAQAQGNAPQRQSTVCIDSADHSRTEPLPLALRSIGDVNRGPG